MAINNLLRDEIVVVTGGSGLIGQSFIKAILNAGGTAIIADLDEAKGEKIKSDLQTSGKIDFITMDITNSDSIEFAINIITRNHGKIDSLVNNAYPRNKNYGKSFFDVQYNDFCENIGLNLGGYFLTSQKFGHYFIDQKKGNIINISSIYGVIAPRFEIYENTSMTMPVEYAAIKSALIHLTKYMAQYFKGHNVRVNAISPGGIFDNQPYSFIEAYNKMCAIKGMLDPDDLSGALLFLLSDLSTYINGQNIVVDDGFSL